jgi:hypothetical protein
MDDELTIRGSLEESSLPELLRSMTKSKESGILTCFVQGYLKSIYLNEGQIVFASSTNPDDRLGETLMRAGKITVQHHLDASKLVRSGRRLGSILIDLNAITSEELMEGVQGQAQEIINGLFDVTRGEYELVLKEVDAHDMIMLRGSTDDVIFDGAKSMRSWSRISRGVGSLSSKLIPSPEAGKVLLNLTLSPEESHLFSLCQKGQFSVGEICSMSYLTSFETFRILWAFLMAGVLQSTEIIEQKPAISTTPHPSSVNVSSMDAELDLHDLVEKYNDLCAHLYDFAFQKIGEGADEIAISAMKLVESAMPKLARGLRLDTYGRLDFDDVMRNLGPIPENSRIELVSSALEEIVYSLLYEIGQRFGPAEQKQLTEEIQQMRKR